MSSAVRIAVVLAIGKAAALSVASVPAAPPDASPCSSSFRRTAHPDGLSVLVSDGGAQMRDNVGVRSVLAAAEVEYVLSIVRRPDFPWTIARHKSFPTTGKDQTDRRTRTLAS